MEELLKINTDSDRITLSARELHEFLEVKTAFKDWFPRMCEYGFNEENDFSSFLSESTGGRPAIDYQITIEMAKEIAMIQRNEKGKQIRQYFIEIEKEWNTPERVMYRGLLASQQIIEDLNTKLLEVKPKVDFYDAVASSKSAIPMDQVAKVLNVKGVGRNKLFELLRNAGVLQSSNVPYQKYVDQGYFRVVESTYTTTNGDLHVNIKTLVYQKGVAFIKRKIIGNCI